MQTQSREAMLWEIQMSRGTKVRLVLWKLPLAVLSQIVDRARRAPHP